MTTRTIRVLQQAQDSLFARPRAPGALPNPIDMYTDGQRLPNRLSAAIPLWDQSPAMYGSRDPHRFPNHVPQGGALQSGAAHAQALSQDYLLRNRIREGEMMQPLPQEAGKRASYPLHSFVKRDPMQVLAELRAGGASSLEAAQAITQNEQQLDDTSSRVLTLVVLGAGMAILLFALS